VGIWRNPPRAEVNLEANPEGSEWILDIAVAARKTVQHAPGPSLIGYVDWRPDNVRLTPQGELAAIYDWDSIQVTGRVHLLAGACSGLTPEAMAAFLSTFEQVTGETLNRNQRLAVAGRVVWSRAMWARYEHVRRLPAAEQRFASHLRDDAIAYPRAATAV
jgi:hypothetical protein